MDLEARYYARTFPELKRIQVKCNIRSYTYVAFIDRKTGKVKAVSGGCRLWRSFAAAFRHYEVGRFSAKYRSFPPQSRTWVLNDLRGMWDNALHRSESIAVLRRLSIKVFAYQAKVRR